MRKTLMSFGFLVSWTWLLSTSTTRSNSFVSAWCQ